MTERIIPRSRSEPRFRLFLCTKVEQRARLESSSALCTARRMNSFIKDDSSLMLAKDETVVYRCHRACVRDRCGRVPWITRPSFTIIPFDTHGQMKPTRLLKGSPRDVDEKKKEADSFRPGRSIQ